MRTSEAMVKLRLKYLVEDVDRHGNVRVYFKRAGQQKIRLHGSFGSDEFMADYGAALKGIAPVQVHITTQDARRAPAGSLRALVAQYFASPEFSSLAKNTRSKRRHYLEALCKRTGKKSGVEIGLAPARQIDVRHIFKWRDEKAETPEEATFVVKCLRGFFKWAHARRLVPTNPAKEVPYLRRATKGFHSWTLKEVEQFEAFHPVGSMARLALALLLYTAQRRSDVVLFGRQHVRVDEDGLSWLYFTQVKGESSKPVTLTLPIIPSLQEIIDATPRPEGATAMNFLLTAYGRSFTAAGFGNRMRSWCDAAGLPQCSAHGLRKAFGARGAELGLTTKMLQAIHGHLTLEESERYTRDADQKALAATGMAMFEESLKARKAIAKGQNQQ